MEPSEEGRVERRLAAILAADVAGYSRLMGIDEEGTLARLKAHQRALTDPKIKEHHGRIVKTTGDGILVEFASVVDAVRCAVDIQRSMAERNASIPPDRRIAFRIGINVGDIIVDGDDIFGDGVNVAARLEALAAPGDIWVSRVVRDQVRDKLAFAFEDMGEREVKNIARPIKAHRIRYDGALPTQALMPARFPAPVAKSSGERRFLPRRHWFIGAAVLVIVAAAGAWFALQSAKLGEDALPPERASIAVLPFDNLSSDPEQAYFSNGITEDILTELARVPGFFVPARNSTSRYNETTVDLKKIGRELGVRYVLEGSVRKSDDQVRVTAQLIEIASGSQVWAQRYDRPLKDIFAVQDEITEAIATLLVAQIKRVDLQAAKRKPTEHMDAYDLVLRGRELMSRTNPEDNAEAKLLYERALTHDPNYADAYAGLAGVYSRGFLFGWGDLTGPPALDKAIEFGQRSLALDPSGAFGAYTLALPYIFRGRLDEAEAVLERAHDAYPNDADVMDRLGVTYVFQGRTLEGIDLLERVLKVDPFHRPAIYAVTARAYLMLKDYDKAAEQLKNCYAHAAKYRVCYEVAAVFYVETGELEKAGEAVATLRRIDPQFTLTTAPAQLPFKIKADQDRFLNAFREAGMPD